MAFSENSEYRILLKSLVRDGIRKSSNFKELWYNLNNDQLFELDTIYQEITGDELSILTSEIPDELWDSFVSIVEKNDKFIEAFNHTVDTLDITFKTQSPHEIGRYKEGFGITCARYK